MNTTVPVPALKLPLSVKSPLVVIVGEADIVTTAVAPEIVIPAAKDSPAKTELKEKRKKKKREDPLLFFTSRTLDRP